MTTRTTPALLQAWAPGLPITQGSKNVTRSGVMYDVKARELRTWRHTVAHHLLLTHRPRTVLTGPVQVGLWFLLPRPKSHLRADGSKAPTAPTLPTNKQDLDKLTRAVFDAITEAGVWGDDGQAVMLTASKSYATLTPPPTPTGLWSRPVSPDWMHARSGLAGPGVAISLNALEEPA